jgi:hypothetical protein
MPRETEAIQKRRRDVEGNAGYIAARRNVYTGDLNTLYDSVEQGIESDPETPYSTVCEVHGTVVCHQTKAQAIGWLSTAEWCEECMGIKKANAKSR